MGNVLRISSKLTRTSNPYQVAGSVPEGPIPFDLPPRRIPVYILTLPSKTAVFLGMTGLLGKPTPLKERLPFVIFVRSLFTF